MKKQYNTIISAFLLTVLVLPNILFAAERSTSTIKPNVFCSRVTEVTDKINSDLKIKTEKFINNREERISKLENKWSTRDQKREENINLQNERQNNRLVALMERADTDAKKQAVNNFKEVITSATKERRESVDNAITSFRNGVQDLIDKRFGNIDSSVVTLRSSVETAISKAKESCVNGVSGDEVRNTLKNEIKLAYEKFKADKTEVIIKTEIENLNNTRKKAVEEAMNKFKVDMEKAKIELREAFMV